MERAVRSPGQGGGGGDFGEIGPACPGLGGGFISRLGYVAKEMCSTRRIPTCRDAPPPQNRWATGSRQEYIGVVHGFRRDTSKKFIKSARSSS